MRAYLSVLSALLISSLAQAEGVTQKVQGSMPALEAYEWGFTHDVMRSPEGVVLNDLVLIENDGPGSGYSEKGTFIESIHKGVQAKKIIDLDDATAEEAHVVLYMEPQGLPDQPPYYLIVNGHRIQGNPLAWHDKQWHWVKVPVEFLRAGPNEIIVGSDAPEEKGYHLLIAREDEYEMGGGKFTYHGNTAMTSANLVSLPRDGEEMGLEAIRVGETSLKFAGGGDTWVRNKLGTTDDVVGEYVIRLNLKRNKAEGYLWSPVIDLWEGLKGMDALKPHCEVSGLRFHGEGTTPPGTSIAWGIRFSDTPDIDSGRWAKFEPLGGGPSLAVDIGSSANRYLQWEARLTTADPLVSPEVRSVTVERSLRFEPPPPQTFYVKDYENPRLRQTSYKYAYEGADTPELAQLRARLGLDELVKEANGDFDKINRVRHLVSSQWYHGSPLPNYPEWNALDILDRRDDTGKGGMCIQFSITFIQALESLGYQARHLNIFNHETVEVYVDELGKWVHADPESLFDSYEYDTETGVPISVLEQHEHFLAKYGLSADNPIDWMSTEPWCNHPDSGLDENTPPLALSTYTAWINNPDPKKRPPQHNLAGFLRMMPRNNYFSQATPRPLSQGSTWWPWDGYLNWYDEATPRKLQYALHTDRMADFYPTLNQVAFSAVHGNNEGDIEIEMTSFTPNFETYEINVDDGGWRDGEAHFVWTLKRSALNTLEMRTRNRLGVTGKPSRIQVLYHYNAPYRPKVAKASP